MKIARLNFGLIVAAFLLFTGTQTQAVNCALNTESMYRPSGSRTVYYITAACKKQVVKNPEVFFSYATSWTQVQVANPMVFEGLPDHEHRFLPWGPRRDFLGGTLIKSPTDPRVFLVSKYTPNGQFGSTTLIPFDSESALTNNGFLWSWVESVAQSVIDNTTISPSKITVAWNNYPPGILYRTPGSVDLFITRGDVYQPSYREYLPSVDEVTNRHYRLDHVPTLAGSFQLTDKSGSTTPSPTQPTADEGSAICADRDTIVTGSVAICKGTTVRVSSAMTARVVSVTATEVVVNLIRNGRNSQTWTIGAGKSKTRDFAAEIGNFSIAFEKRAVLSESKKAVAYLRFGSATTQNQNLNTFNCQNQSGGDSVYTVCASNTIYHTTTGVTFKIDQYSGESMTVSYSAPKPDGTALLTGTLTMRTSESQWLVLPWSGRTVRVSFYSKSPYGWASVGVTAI